MGRFLGITVKLITPCLFLDGHVKEPYEMSMAWEPDRSSNFFFIPPAHGDTSGQNLTKLRR